MRNFDVKEFMDGLSPEIQERIRVCKSADEIAEELSEEQLDDITGERGGIPIAMAAMMLFSSLAPLAANAAENNSPA
jgi:hypothetical protein